MPAWSSGISNSGIFLSHKSLVSLLDVISILFSGLWSLLSLYGLCSLFLFSSSVTARSKVFLASRLRHLLPLQQAPSPTMIRCLIHGSEQWSDMGMREYYACMSDSPGTVCLRSRMMPEAYSNIVAMKNACKFAVGGAGLCDDQHAERFEQL